MARIIYVTVRVVTDASTTNICTAIVTALEKRGAVATVSDVGDTAPNGLHITDWRLVWSPEGREIARVSAPSARAAIRKAPFPYRKFKGEIYAEEIK